MTPQERSALEAWRIQMRAEKRKRKQREKSRLSVTTEVVQKHRGAYSEMVAVTWLFEKGYEVFRNVSGYGEVDIVVRAADGEYTSIDVKTVRVFKTGDGVRVEESTLTQSQTEQGIVPLFVTHEGYCNFRTAPIKAAYEEVLSEYI